jgi:hypothetical protein
MKRYFKVGIPGPMPGPGTLRTFETRAEAEEFKGKHPGAFIEEADEEGKIISPRMLPMATTLGSEGMIRARATAGEGERESWRARAEAGKGSGARHGDAANWKNKKSGNPFGFPLFCLKRFSD